MKKASLVMCSLIIAGLTHYYSFSQQTKKPVAKATAKTAKGKATASTKTMNSKADIEEGKNLVSKSDCLACHQLQVKVVGPSYSSVAEKYDATEANINLLSDKIIKGGSGTWGPIAMLPHPTLKASDAKKMVQYVLSLKSK